MRDKPHGATPNGGTDVDELSIKDVRELLDRSEEKLALAVSGARIGIFDHDLASGLIVATEQNANLLGMRPESPATAVLSEQYSYGEWTKRVHPDDLAILEAEMGRCSQDRAPLDTEYRVLWPDGSTHWLALRGAFRCNSEGRSTRLLGVHMDVTEHRNTRQALDRLRRDMNGAVEERTAELRDMTTRLDEAQEQERQRIASGLHDEVAQLVAAGQIKMAEARDIQDNDEQNAVLDDADRLMSEAADEIRGLTFELSSASLFAEGFVAAAKELCAHMTNRHGVRFSLDAPENEPPLPREVRLALYHCLRELLYNVVKHAGVDEASVRIQNVNGTGETAAKDNRVLRIVVRDYGKGFDSADLDRPLTREGGFGLRHLRERLRQMGGSLRVESVPHDGTKAIAEVPLRSPQAPSRG